MIDPQKRIRLEVEGFVKGFELGRQARARDFKRYEAAVEEHIESTKKPTTGREDTER